MKERVFQTTASIDTAYFKTDELHILKKTALTNTLYDKIQHDGKA